jgi:hypothetical protein
LYLIPAIDVLKTDNQQDFQGLWSYNNAGDVASQFSPSLHTNFVNNIAKLPKGIYLITIEDK